MTIEALKLSDLKIDGGTQPREAICEQTVSEYADALRAGAAFPPVVVFHDGATYWLVDGFHRFHAHRRCGKTSLDADVNQGTLRDAVLHSLAANTDHGLRRTNADKRKAVVTMLTNELVSTDEDGNPWSDSEVARRCAVSRDLVMRTRSSLAESASDKVARPRSYTSKHGTRAVMKTGNIGRSRNAKPPSSRKPGGLAQNAFKPVRGHSTPMKKTAIELPHDPHWAARGLLSTFGADFVRALISELTNCLEGAGK